MESVFCPVKTAEVSYRHQISKTLLHDGQHRDEGEIRMACNSHYVVITSCSMDFSYSGPTYFLLHQTKSLCNHTSNVTDKISDGCYFVGPESTYFKLESSTHFQLLKELTIKYFTPVELTISDNNSCTLTNHHFGKRT